MKQKVYKITVEFVLCWPASPGHQTCPEVWLKYPVRFHWKTPILPSSVGIYYRELLGYMWEPTSTYPSQCWCPLALPCAERLGTHGHIGFVVSLRYCLLGVVGHL